MGVRLLLPDRSVVHVQPSSTRVRVTKPSSGKMHVYYSQLPLRVRRQFGIYTSSSRSGIRGVHIPRPGIFQVQVVDLNNPKSLIHIGNFRDSQVAAVAASMGSTPDYNVRGVAVRRELDRLAHLDSGKKGSVWEKVDDNVPTDNNPPSELQTYLADEYDQAKVETITLPRDFRGGEARVLALRGAKFAYRGR